MGQAKNRGTPEQREAEGRARRAQLTQQFNVWSAEVAEFRKLFNLDVGIIGGAPPESRLVVCKLDALRQRLLGLTKAPKETVTVEFPQIEEISGDDVRAAGWRSIGAFVKQDQLLNHLSSAREGWPNQLLRCSHDEQGFHLWVMQKKLED